MIESTAIKKQQEETRISIRSSAHQFETIIQRGTHCSPFEAQIISSKALEVFHLGDYAHLDRPQPGQLVWRAIDAHEPPGKPLKECLFKEILLTFHNLEDDRRVKADYGLSKMRQQQILRMTSEAADQGAYLTQEDLSAILGSDIKTIRNDIKKAQKEFDILIPTRGNKLDIGPEITHRELAVEKFICGMNPVEIARNMQHSLRAIERYTHTFSRAIYCQNEVQNTMKTAMVVGISVPLLNKYLNLHEKYKKDPRYKARLEEIEETGGRFWKTDIAKKKPTSKTRKEIK
jgi:DNA-binding CsgD family transcriptional regulator